MSSAEVTLNLSKDMLPITNEEANNAVREAFAISGTYYTVSWERFGVWLIGEGSLEKIASINLLKFSGYYTYRQV